MNEAIEVIDSSKMEILSEAQILDADEPENQHDYHNYRFGVLENNFVIAVQPDPARKALRKNMLINADEYVKAAYAQGSARDWWSATMAFELQNFDAVLMRLEEIFGLRAPREIDLNDFDIVNGKDKLGVRVNSIMPNNVGQPIVSLQIANARRLNWEGVELGRTDLFASLAAGEAIMKEMQKIQPIIKTRLQTLP